MPACSPLRRSVRAASPRRAVAILLSLLLTSALLPSAPLAAARRGDEPETPTFKRAPVRKAAEFVPGQLLVRFREDSPVLVAGNFGADVPPPAALETRDMVLPVTAADSQASLNVKLEYFGGTELVPGLLLGRVNAADTLAAVEALNARPDVLYAEPDYIHHKLQTPNDPRFPEMFGLQRISAPAAWDITTGSDSVVVGIVDGGVDLEHQDLQANKWVNPGDSTVDGVDNDGNGFVDDVNGWDFANNNRTVFDGEDGDDHGTHVAGTVGARGNNGVGVTGVNWNVKLMSLKVLGPGGGSTSDIVAGYNYARTMRARGVNLRVLNNSYGGSGADNASRDAIQALAGADILFVAAAGNESRDNFAFPHFPSDFNLTNMLGVASTNSGEGLSGFSNFSSRMVSMGAPGSGILSTVPTSMNVCGTGSAYCAFSGTSMATPHVSGAAALVVAAKPSITMQELRGVLAYSGDPLPSLAERTTTGRRLNVRKAIDSALENDSADPAPAANLQILSVSGRTLNLSWTAPGDDGMSGTAADYDFFWVNSANGVRTLLPTSFLPAAGGSTQTAGVNVPFRSTSGTLELVTYDNTGRKSTASIPVNVPLSAGLDPYVVTQSGAGGLSTGGTRLALDGDDKYLQNLAIGFTFPFMGQLRNSLTVSSNGVLYFSTPPFRDNGDADDVPSSTAALRGQAMIAGLWDDLFISTASRSDAGVFEVRPSADRVIYRFQTTEFSAQTSPVNFEIELRQDGTIIFRYGSGNTTLRPVVGVAGGDPEPYIVTSHTSESASINLTNAASVTFSPRPAAVSTFQFSQANYEVNENAGAATITVTRAGDTSNTQSVIATADPSLGGTATDISDYQVASVMLTFGPGETTKTFNVNIVNDAAVEPDETVHMGLASPTNNATLGAPSRARLFIHSDDQGGANTSQFSAAGVSVGEGAGRVTVSVTRSGDTSQPASVSYATSNGTATELGDYTTALGTLNFAAGETAKSFDILVTDDVFDDDNETFTVSLSSPSATSLGAQSTLTVTITDNDAATQFSPVREQNFSSDFFVRQHYIDFFNREADAPGLAFWKNQIDECTTAGCRDIRKVNVSAAFFLSIEFHETGFLVYRTHQAAFNTKENLAFRDFMRDHQRIGRGVVIGAPGADALLESNKVAFFNDFVARPAFLARYPLTMTNAQYVNALNANTGNAISQTSRDALIAGLDNLSESRATVLRKIAENQTFGSSERSRAFVYMQYVGYLRRQPDAAGFTFWFGKLNEHNGDFISSEMVRSFIVSGEYLARFGTP